MKTFLCTIACIFLTGSIAAQTWTSLSSPSAFKNVRDLTMNDGGNKWYAADEVKLLKSTDTAKTWTATSSVINGPIAVACKDDNPDVVFVSGSNFFKKSTNGGTSWTDIAVTNKPTAMVNFPQNENCFLVGRKYLSSSEKAIFRTTDGGTTWSQELSTSHQTTIFDLNVNPNPGWPGYAVGAGSPTGAQTDKGVYETPNYGATWYAKNTSTGIGFTACAIIKWHAHIDSSWVYAGTADGKLYRERYNNTLTQLGSFTGMTTDTIRAIRINRSRYTTVYVLTDRTVYRTVNNGTSWSIVSSGMVDSRGLSMDFHPSDTTQLVVGSRGHIYRSTNTTSSWTIIGSAATRTLPIGSISKAGSKFFGASDALTMEMHYDGSTWDTSRLGRNDSVFLTKHSLTLFNGSGARYAFHSGMGDNTARVHWSTDSGATFTDVDPFKTSVTGTSCEGIVPDPSYPSRLYAYGMLRDGANARNYFESANYGATWTKPSEAGITQTNTWYALLPMGDGSGSASQFIYSGVQLGSGNGGIWRSQDEGSNWYRVSGGTTGDISIRSLAHNPKALAYAYAGGQGGLWYSSNANHTSKDTVSFANPWTTAEVKKIVIDPRFTDAAHNSAYVFWIASNNTIYRSETSGSQATAVNGDLPAGIVLNDLRTDPADSTLLYLATDQGVYQAQLIRAPSLISPANNATNLLYCISTTEPLVFSWWGVSGATGYDIQIDDDPAFGSKLLDASTSATTYSLTSDLDSDTVYYWRVRASDGTSFGKSPFRTFQFTTSGEGDELPAPTLLSPDSAATGVALNVQLTWGAVAGAVKYKVNVSGRPAIYTSNTSYAPGLAEGTNYTWNVTAINCNANVNISPTWPLRTCTDCQQRPEGPETIHQEVEAENVVTEYALLQNYPNPFNPTTRFDYALLEDGPVHLRIYNTLGEEVATLIDVYQSRGWKSVEYDAGHLPSGIYFYRLDAGRFVSIKKMVLLK